MRRCWLVHYLSKDLDTATAAKLLHCSETEVRACRKTDYSDSDLLQDKYARDVTRQKTDPSVLTELMEFLAAACPTKSGSRHLTFYQYITDQSLYEAYVLHSKAPVSFNTFMKIKQWLRVRHKRKYLGMFDCPHCFRLGQMPALKTAAASDVAEFAKLQLEEWDCKKHQETRFSSSISTC